MAGSRMRLSGKVNSRDDSGLHSVGAIHRETPATEAMTPARVAIKIFS
jgi:hypothetical protein